MGTSIDADGAATEFHEFFEAHYAELARLAHLLTGEADAADDLAADALLALWHRWDRVRSADHPVAYARGVVANLARTRIRSAVRERRRIALFWAPRGGGDGYAVEDPDVSAMVDVQGRCAGCRSASAPAWYCGTPSTSRSGTPRWCSGSRWVR